MAVYGLAKFCLSVISQLSCKRRDKIAEMSPNVMSAALFRRHGDMTQFADKRHKIGEPTCVDLVIFVRRHQKNAESPNLPLAFTPIRITCTNPPKTQRQDSALHPATPSKVGSSRKAPPTRPRLPPRHAKSLGRRAARPELVRRRAGPAPWRCADRRSTHRAISLSPPPHDQ